MNEIEMELMSLTVRPSDLRKSGATTKHNGINSTRERLKDQLVIAADGLIALEVAKFRAETSADKYHGAYQEWRGIAELGPLARLARWVRGLRS